MNYETIYELTDIEGKIMNIIPITLFVIIGISILYFAKRFLENGTFRQRTMLFFGFLMTIISSIILVTFLIRIPKIISSNRELKTVIENKSYLRVEGLTENYSIKNINGSNFESFSVEGVIFKYSDNVNINGFHQTSKKNGPISENGQHVRIGYMKMDNDNLIMKLEIYR